MFMSLSFMSVYVSSMSSVSSGGGPSAASCWRTSARPMSIEWSLKVAIARREMTASLDLPLATRKRGDSCRRTRTNRARAQRRF